MRGNVANAAFMALWVLSAAAAAGPSLDVDPPAAFRRRANLTVKWQLPSPNSSIYVSAWSPPDFELPVKYASLNTSAGWSSGRGEIIFELLNIRHPVEFRMTSGSPVDPTKATTTLAITKRLVFPEALPMQIHSSSTGRAGELQLMWVDNSSLTPVVAYGSQNSSAGMNKRAVGSSVTYTRADLAACMTKDTTATRRFINPGWIHRVVLKDLEEGAFFYRVGTKEPDQPVSDVFHHRGPLPLSNDAVKILYVADMGVGPARPDEISGALDAEGGAINRENAGPKSGGRLVVQSILKHEELESFNMVLHNGDLSYACGEGWIHEEFAALVEPLASVIPYHVSLGNHEWDHGDGSVRGWNETMEWCREWSCKGYSEDSGGDCGIPYRTRFSMPEGVSATAPSPTMPVHKSLASRSSSATNALRQHRLRRHRPASRARMVNSSTGAMSTSGSGASSGDIMSDFKAYYSLNVGPLHIVVITTEMDFTNSSAQHAWLENDLKSVDRSATPWVLVAHHRQIYLGSGLPSDPVQRRMQQDLEPLYIEHKVDVVLSGHEHTYARMCALKHDKCVAGSGAAPIYIVDGTAGAYTGAGTQGVSCEQPKPPFPAGSNFEAKDCVWGWSTLEVDAKSFRWEHKRWSTGEVVDSVELAK